MGDASGGQNVVEPLLHGIRPHALLPQPIADQSGVGATQTALPMAAAPAPSGADFARSGQFDDSYFAPAGESLLSVLGESPAQASAPRVRL